MTTFRFASPWLLALLPLAILTAWSLARRRRRADARTLLPGAGLRLRIGTSPWQRLESCLPWFRGAVLVILVAALARPQAGTRIETVTSYGVDIMLVLDVSRSMLAEDFPGNRLEEARRTLQRFIDGRPSDRIGLVVFAGVAVTRCPLTLDHEMLRQFLADVDFADPERGHDGTAVGMGLATAVSRLRRSDAEGRVIVLLTDGSNNKGQISPETAAEAARSLGIRVYPIGVGTQGLAPVPMPTPVGIRRVATQVDIDEDLLRAVAERTQGRYFRATDSEGLSDIFANIDALEPTKIKSRVRTLHTELFPYALLPGVLLLGLERLLLATRLRRIP